MVSDERTVPLEYLERLEARPAISQAEYRDLRHRVDDLRAERNFFMAERDTQAAVLNRRIGYLEQALRMCRDCHSVKQVRTIVRTALATGSDRADATAATAGAAGTEGRP